MENRKNPRFRTQDNCYAVLSKNYSKVGKICDISLGGLAFRYLGMEMVAEPSSHVDIFLVNNGFYLYNMPCEIIYETEDESFGIASLPQMFRCGLQFGECTESQSEQLESFIENYTTGPSAV